MLKNQSNPLPPSTETDPSQSSKLPFRYISEEELALGEPKSEKIPFEIISVNERSSLGLCELEDDDSIKLSTIQLINLLNVSIANRKNPFSWYKQLTDLFEQIKNQSDSEHKEEASSSPQKIYRTLKTNYFDPKELKNSLDSYLKAANTLQQARDAEVEKWVTVKNKKGEQKTIGATVNEYQSFWKNCLREMLYSFLLGISKLPKEELLQNNKGKRYLYVILVLKNQVIPKLASEDKISNSQKNELIKDIGISIGNLLLQCNIESNFVLNHEDIENAYTILAQIVGTGKKILDLREYFESNEEYARYIHVPPLQLIQFFQAINS